jgi:hypothetical protein
MILEVVVKPNARAANDRHFCQMEIEHAIYVAILVVRMLIELPVFAFAAITVWHNATKCPRACTSLPHRTAGK